MSSPHSPRRVATVLITDIVGSTERLTELGDEKWNALLLEHNAVVRSEIERHRGREISTAGDSFLAVFESPAEAIECALEAVEGVRCAGVDIRAGVHTGEIVETENDVRGIAVHICARVSAKAGPGEVWVSRTVRDLVRGSDLQFRGEGTHELKGVAGEWRLYAVQTEADRETADATRGAHGTPVPDSTSTPSLWSRIRNGRMVRIVAVYGVLSWVLLQGVGTLIDRTSVPESVAPAAMVLLGIGLIVVIATAWVQSHPTMPDREAADEVPADWELALGEIREAISEGRMPHLNWARAITGGAIAFLLLFGFAGLYVVIQDRGRSFTPTEAIAEGAAPGIAVLPFSVNNPELDVWREGMVDLLGTNLDGIAGLRTIDSRTVLARWRESVGEGDAPDLNTAREIARRTGARFVLVGSAVAIGAGVRLGVEVYDVDTGAELGKAQVEGSTDDVFGLVDQLSIDILQSLVSDPEGEIPGVNLARVTTSSVSALRAFLEGEARYRHSDFEGARGHYEEAVAADSMFALAHYRLALTYGWIENVGSDLIASATRAASRGLDRLPEREVLLVQGLSGIAYGSLEALEPLQQAVRRFPDDAEAWYLLGETYMHMGDMALVRREEVEPPFARATELDPSFTPAYIHLVDAAISLVPDSATAESRWALYEPLATETEWIPRQRLAIDLAFGTEETRANALASLDTTSVDLSGLIANDLWSAEFGEAATQVLEHELASAQPGENIRLPKRMYFFSVVNQGHLGRAWEVVEEPALGDGFKAVELHSIYNRGLPVPQALLDQYLKFALPEPDVVQVPRVFAAGAYAADQRRWSDHAEAVQWIRSSGSNALVEADSAGARYAEGAAEALEGYEAWKRGRRGPALEALQSAQPRAAGHMGRKRTNWVIRAWLADLLLELDRPVEAEEYLHSFWGDAYYTYRHGQVLEELGEYEEARKAYEFFVTSWKDADPQLEPWVEQGRQAILRLSGLRRD